MGVPIGVDHLLVTLKLDLAVASLEIIHDSFFLQVPYYIFALNGVILQVDDDDDIFANFLKVLDFQFYNYLDMAVQAQNWTPITPPVDTLKDD